MKQAHKKVGKYRRTAKSFRLRSGFFSLVYHDGALRSISVGETEVIRMIYFAVRDRDWLTLPAEQSRFSLKKSTSGFRIGFTNHYRLGDMDFRVRITYRANTAGKLVAMARGIALNGFLKNRIGFCVLHPPDTCCGRECEVVHSDGSVSLTAFPMQVVPHQPFLDVKGIHWKPGDDITARLQFHGDVFETEDQRNWTDASFKTYSTPLSLPHPARIEKGSRVNQRIKLKINAGKIPAKKKEPVTICLNGTPPRPFPEIGTCATSRLQPVTDAEAEKIRHIGFSHLRVELLLDAEDLEQQVTAKDNELAKTRLPAELCLFFGRNPVEEFHRFLGFYSGFIVRRILVFSKYHPATPDDLAAPVMPLIRKAFPSIPCGAGTNCNFAELNRSAIPSGFDLQAFAVHPQEHAADNLTLMENTAAQAHVVNTARIKEKLPVFVTPVTLQRRFNANKAYAESLLKGSVRTETMDCRQMSLFAAAWTLGSLKHLCQAGAAGLTYYETVGERGIMMGDFEGVWKEFKAKRGMRFPVYHLFRVLLSDRPTFTRDCESSRPLVADALVFETRKQVQILVANMTPFRQQILLKGFPDLHIRSLQAGNFNHMRSETTMPEEERTDENGMFVLRPYETVLAVSGLTVTE